MNADFSRHVPIRNNSLFTPRNIEQSEIWQVFWLSLLSGEPSHSRKNSGITVPDNWMRDYSCGYSSGFAPDSLSNASEWKHFYSKIHRKDNVFQGGSKNL